MFRLNAGQPRDSDTLSPLVVILQITCFFWCKNNSRFFRPWVQDRGWFSGEGWMKAEAFRPGPVRS